MAARRIRMGFLPRKSEVVHVKLTLGQALEQLRLQCVNKPRARLGKSVTFLQVQQHKGPRRSRRLAHDRALIGYRL